MSEDDDIVLGRPGHEPGDAGTPLWYENQRKAMEEMNAGLADQLRAKRATPMSEAQPETVAGDPFAFKPPVRHVRVLGKSMEPDPERAGQMRQTAFCSTCAGETQTLDPRWPCEFVRGQAEARAAGAARYEAAIEEGRRRRDDLRFCNKPDQCHVKADGAALVIDDIETMLAASPLRDPEQRDGLDVERLWEVLAGRIQSRWFADDITTVDLQEMANVITAEYARLTPSRPAEERKP